ncbi:MAG: penicillin-binding protein [Coriobacteriales bacterium]|nr:penicillin-binding protein [Coriobacteriales bacterium]
MTARTRKIRSTAKPRIGKYLILGTILFTLAFIAAFLVAGVQMCLAWLEDLPDYSDTDSYLLAEPTTVLDADGNVIAEFYMENRTPIMIDECSPYILQATVDIEDERYYSHNGVDYRGIMRAVVAQIAGGSGGASTITQQLVRNTVLKDEQFEHTLRRKLREAYIALQLEKMYSKDQILMMYLNSIYYGAGCYGVEAASETYFGKTCAELTLAEAATIAGLPQSPSSYDPTQNPELALERRNSVLYRMLANGDISQATYEDTVEQPLVLNYTPRVQSGAYAYPYFVDYVKTRLSQQFSTDIIFKGGLTVKTTIVPSIQAVAEEAVDSVIGLAYDDLEAALIAIDPHTGHIKAMIGGRDYNVDQFNLATQARRQPGSSFKMFTLTAAIQAGMNPDIYINCNSPVMVGDWYVNNFGYQSYGILSLKQATWISSNTGYAQVIDEIGAQSVVDVAHAMGIKSDLEPYNSLTLGTQGCSVLEMCSAYGTLATGGIYIEPTAITEVYDRNGNILYQYEAYGVQAISPEVAYAVTNVLEGVISGDPSWATGYAAALTVNQPVAGKTGTTESYRDLWFCGYTPQLACAVWCGYRVDATVYYLGAEGRPYSLSCPIFSRFMSNTLNGLPRSEFPFAYDPLYLDSSYFSFGLGTWVYIPPAPEPTTTTTPSDSTKTDENSSSTTNTEGQTNQTNTDNSGGAGYTETAGT